MPVPTDISVPVLGTDLISGYDVLAIGNHVDAEGVESFYCLVNEAVKGKPARYALYSYDNSYPGNASQRYDFQLAPELSSDDYLVFMSAYGLQQLHLELGSRRAMWLSYADRTDRPGEAPFAHLLQLLHWDWLEITFFDRKMFIRQPTLRLSYQLADKLATAMDDFCGSCEAITAKRLRQLLDEAAGPPQLPLRHERQVPRWFLELTRQLLSYYDQAAAGNYDDLDVLERVAMPMLMLIVVLRLYQRPDPQD